MQALPANNGRDGQGRRNSIRDGHTSSRPHAMKRRACPYKTLAISHMVEQAIIIGDHLPCRPMRDHFMPSSARVRRHHM